MPLQISLVLQAREEAVERRIVLFLVVLALCFVAVFTFFSAIQSGKSEISYQNITVQEFDKALKRNPFVVDVHTPEQKHIEGTDAFIDYSQVKARLDEFPKDKNTEILVYCRSGSMSAEASQVLSDAGYTNVKNLIGGVNAYSEQHRGVNIVPDTQDLGEVIYGDTPTTEFVMTNNTNETVKVTRVTTSCSCTKADVENKVLSPGQSTKVNVSFNPAIHKDDTDLGDITRSIYIETDHINFPKISSAITAYVIKK
jgi:rhodanese-related sulfurtransferase